MPFTTQSIALNVANEWLVISMGKKYLLTAEQIDEIYNEGKSHWDGWFKGCTAFDWCGEMLEKCEYDERTCHDCQYFDAVPEYKCESCMWHYKDNFKKRAKVVR